jgi:hypothetical protein
VLAADSHTSELPYVARRAARTPHRRSARRAAGALVTAALAARLMAGVLLADRAITNRSGRLTRRTARDAPSDARREASQSVPPDPALASGVFLGLLVPVLI